MKILCRNNLRAVGKWDGAYFLFGLFAMIFMFGGNNTVHAYVVETMPAPTQAPQLNLDLNSLNKISDITAPVTNLINNAINSFGSSPNVNISTGIPISPTKNTSQTPDFSKFFSSSKVSSSDVTGFLKQAVVTAINLTILVFSIASQVLKGLLSVFNK